MLGKNEATVVLGGHRHPPSTTVVTHLVNAFGQYALGNPVTVVSRSRHWPDNLSRLASF